MAKMQERGPARRGFWRSPIRGPWLTSVFGLMLLIGITVMFITGLLSYDAYNPTLPGNDTTPGHGSLGFYFFDWPTHPYWLYRVTQGLHVTLGIVLVPVLLGKLWSVIPKLFELPPVRSVANAIERVSLLLLVGGVMFEFVTGIMDVQYWYKFPGSFYTLHLYGAWVFIAAFVVHVSIKFPKMRRSLKSRRWGEVLRTNAARTRPEPPDPDGLVSPNPAPASMSRRGAIGLVGAGSLLLLLTTLGQSIGGSLRRTALFAPRGTNPGHGPNGFQINKTASNVGVARKAVDPAWRLELVGTSRHLIFTRDQLTALAQHRSHLPIACVEGWSTPNQAWEGLRLRDLAAMAGVSHPSRAYVESLQRGGFGAVTLRGNQIVDTGSLLALRVNGATLSVDHGYPARIIVPDNPGVHNTKWVTRITFHP